MFRYFPRSSVYVYILLVYIYFRSALGLIFCLHLSSLYTSALYVCQFSFYFNELVRHITSIVCMFQVCVYYVLEVCPYFNSVIRSGLYLVYSQGLLAVACLSHSSSTSTFLVIHRSSTENSDWTTFA